LAAHQYDKRWGESVYEERRWLVCFGQCQSQRPTAPTGPPVSLGTTRGDVRQIAETGGRNEVYTRDQGGEPLDSTKSLTTSSPHVKGFIRKHRIRYDEYHRALELLSEAGGIKEILS